LNAKNVVFHQKHSIKSAYFYKINLYNVKKSVVQWSHEVHTDTQDGTWVGGFTTLRADLPDMLEELRERATEWKQPFIATRLDKRGRGQKIVIEPR